MGESESLSANPFESHLCFFSHSPLTFLKLSGPKFSAGKEWKRERGSRGWRERGGTFLLWMFPVVLSVHKRFQASRSRRAFLANTGGQAHYLLLTDHSKRKGNL